MANDTDILLAAISNLEARLGNRLDGLESRMDRADARTDALFAELTATRSGIMDRMDRIQDALTDLKDDLTVTHATAERVERATATARDEIEGVRSLTRGVGADLGTLNTQILALARKSRRADDRRVLLESRAA